jgi:hypothetical protein
MVMMDGVDGFAELLTRLYGQIVLRYGTWLLTMILLDPKHMATIPIFNLLPFVPLPLPILFLILFLILIIEIPQNIKIIAIIFRQYFT